MESSERRKFIKALTKKGFSCDHIAGGHEIFKNVDGVQVSVPTTLHKYIAKDIARQYGLEWNK